MFSPRKPIISVSVKSLCNMLCLEALLAKIGLKGLVLTLAGNNLHYFTEVIGLFSRSRCIKYLFR
ncbi:hypothetical protein NIB75_08280 [Bacteroides uniformis]|nr:hypothetical protein [Bacteroides uniformis]